MNQTSLQDGLSRDVFIQHCIDTRKVLLDTPANASDDGCVFSTAAHVLPDCIIKYDYSLRTQDGSIVTPFPFYMHPHYGFQNIEFPTQKSRANGNFAPLGSKLKLKEVQLKIDHISEPFRRIVQSDQMRVYEVVSSEIDFASEHIYGRLSYTKVMRAMGLQKNTVYAVRLHVQDDYFCKYFFRFV